MNLDVVAASQPLSRRIMTVFEDLSLMTCDAASSATLNPDTSILATCDEVDKSKQILSSLSVTVEELSHAGDVAI